MKLEVKNCKLETHKLLAAGRVRKFRVNKRASHATHSSAKKLQNYFLVILAFWVN